MNLYNIFEQSDDKISFIINEDKSFAKVIDKFSNILDFGKDFMLAPKSKWEDIKKVAGGNAVEVSKNNVVSDIPGQSSEHTLQMVSFSEPSQSPTEESEFNKQNWMSVPDDGSTTMVDFTPTSGSSSKKNSTSIDDMTTEIEESLSYISGDYENFDYVNRVSQEFLRRIGSLKDKIKTSSTLLTMLDHYFKKMSISDQYFDDVFHTVSTMLQNDEMMAEGGQSTQSKFEKHLAKHGYDVNEKQKYWEQKIKDIDAQIAAWEKDAAARGIKFPKDSVDETVLNPRNPREDYLEKKKYLMSLGRTLGIDPAEVQKRLLQLDKEASELGVDSMYVKETMSSTETFLSDSITGKFGELFTQYGDEFVMSVIKAVANKLDKAGQTLNNSNIDRAMDTVVKTVKKRAGELTESKLTSLLEGDDNQLLPAGQVVDLLSELSDSDPVVSATAIKLDDSADTRINMVKVDGGRFVKVKELRDKIEGIAGTGSSELQEGSKTSMLKTIKDSVTADQISKDREGNLIFRKGYYYSNGGNSDKFAQSVARDLDNAGISYDIIDSGDVWKAFKGGAPVKDQSHWWVKVRLNDQKVDETLLPDGKLSDNDYGPFVVKERAGRILSLANAFAAKQVEKYKKYQVDSSSRPAGPDTSKFRSSQQGMIEFAPDTEVSGGYYGFKRFYQCFVKIGSSVDLKVQDKMKLEFLRWFSKTMGVPPMTPTQVSMFITSDGYSVMFGSTDGSAWGGYGLMFNKNRESEGHLEKYNSRQSRNVAEAKLQKKADRYHINKDGKPATLASYADKESAIRDRDAKYPGAKVHQVGPRGKVKAEFDEGEDVTEAEDVGYDITTCRKKVKNLQGKLILAKSRRERKGDRVESTQERRLQYQIDKIEDYIREKEGVSEGWGPEDTGRIVGGEWRTPAGDSVSDLQSALRNYKNELQNSLRNGESRQRIGRIRDTIARLEDRIKQGQDAESGNLDNQVMEGVATAQLSEAPTAALAPQVAKALKGLGYKLDAKESTPGRMKTWWKPSQSHISITDLAKTLSTIDPTVKVVPNWQYDNEQEQLANATRLDGNLLSASRQGGLVFVAIYKKNATGKLARQDQRHGLDPDARLGEGLGTHDLEQAKRGNLSSGVNAVAEGFSDSRLVNLPGGDRDRPFPSTRIYSDEEKKKRFDDWVKASQEKRKQKEKQQGVAEGEYPYPGYAIQFPDGEFEQSISTRTPVWWSSIDDAKRFLEQVYYGDGAKVVKVKLKRDPYGYNGYSIERGVTEGENLDEVSRRSGAESAYSKYTSFTKKVRQAMEKGETVESVLKKAEAASADYDKLSAQIRSNGKADKKWFGSPEHKLLLRKANTAKTKADNLNLMASYIERYSGGNQELDESDGNLEELQSLLWDLYKEHYGVRPRHWTQEQWADRGFLEDQLAQLEGGGDLAEGNNIPGYADWFLGQQKKKDARAANRKNTKDAQSAKIDSFKKSQKQGVAETSDYFRRRQREEDIISGKKPARKKAPAQTSDYARRREQEKKQGVAEGSEIQIPTEDGISWQDIRLLAGEGKLTQKTIKQAIDIIRRQRQQKQGVSEAAAGHTIEAHGIRGMNRKPWRKTFKNEDQLYAWADKYDAEVLGTRDLEQAKRGNLSSGVNAVAEGWGAERQRRELEAAEARWRPVFDKYEDDPVMTDYLKFHRIYGGNTPEQAERKALADAKAGKKLPDWWTNPPKLGYKISA